MELTKLWADNKKAITTTAIVVVVGLLIIKFFNVIFWGGLLVAIAVGAVLGWGYLVKKHGSPHGVWKAILAEMGIK